MSLLDDYKVLCMSCGKAVTKDPLIVPVKARGNRPATEHIFHASPIECANAPEKHIIHMHKERHVGYRIG
jgi:hypothetical protein